MSPPVTAFYGNDFERDRLRAHIVTLENIHEHDEKEDVAIKEIINHLSVSVFERMVPHVVKLIQLYLVCPSLTATAERSFSQLKRIKIYFRTTLGQEKLDHLTILAVYNAKLDNLDLNTFIDRSELQPKVFKII